MLNFCPLGVSTNSVFLYVGVTVSAYYYNFVFSISKDEKCREWIKHDILWLNGAFEVIFILFSLIILDLIFTHYNIYYL